MHALRGEHEQALGFLAELEVLGKSRYVSPVYQAGIHLALGDRTKTLELLEQGREDRCGSLMNLKINSDWEPLRDDPGFHELLRKVGLEK